MKKTVLAWASLLAIIAVQPAWGSDDVRHQHGNHMHGPLHGAANNPCSMMGEGKGMAAMPGSFMKESVIDGFDVTFHIMKAMKSLNHGGSHNVMIKVEKDGDVLTDIAVNSKVTHPNGKSESKMMMRMGDWYMASYDLNHSGKHQIMVLFKTSNGTKHFGGIDFSGSEK